MALDKQSKRVFWSISITDRIGIAKFIPVIKLAELLDSGSHVTVFIGDLHSQILGDKSPTWKAKRDYYKLAIRTMISTVTDKLDALSIVNGSKIELDSKFMLDFYLIAGSTPVNRATEAGKQFVDDEHPLLGGLVYPIVRTVDEKYVEVDHQLAAESEKDVLKFSDELSFKVKHQAKERIFYPLLSGLSAGKLALKQPEDDEIDLLDTPDQVKKKLGKAFCEPGNILDNGVLPILRHIIFPVYKSFHIVRPTEYGGDVDYLSIDEVEKDFKNQSLHPGDLKKGVELGINKLLEKLREFYQTNEEFKKAISEAFPIKKNKNNKIVPIRAPPSLKNLSLESTEEVLTPDEKLHLITRGLKEFLQQKTLETIIKERNLKIYWGSATTGRPHVAYFVPMAKIADFLRAGCDVTILLADLHGYLDSQKAPWDLLDARTKYYQSIIVSMLKSIGVPIEKLRIVRGTEFELSEDFSNDVFRLIAQTSLHDAKKAGAQVVKQMSDPLIGSLLYPLLQALDEEYLDCDAQFGGVDQRKIFTYAQDFLPKIGYKKRIHFMNPMVPGLSGGKMSSSEIESKIDLLDDDETVRNKLNSAQCDINNLADNGVLAFIEHVIWPLFDKLTIESTHKEYTEYGNLVMDFTSGVLSGEDLKSSTAFYINKLLDPIRKEFQQDELKALTKKAYPLQ